MKIALFVLLALSPAFGQTITGSSGDYQAVFEKTFDVAAGGTLKLYDIEGDVLIRSEKASQVKVLVTMKVDVYTHQEVEEIVQRAMSGIGRKNGMITVSGSGQNNGVENDYRIVTPKKFNLQVETLNGDIDITGVDGNIGVNSASGDVTLAELNGHIQVETAGGDLDFNNLSGVLQAHSSGGDVKIKNNSAESTIRTDGGDIDLSDSKGMMKLVTYGGNITLAKISGKLEVETMGGDITLKNAEGEKMVLHSLGGDIDVSESHVPLTVATEGGDIDARTITQDIGARTSGGSIVLDDLQASASALTMGGDIDIRMTLRDMKKRHAIQAETTGGDINVELPSRLPATITAEVMIARRSGNRNDIYSDFPLTKESSNETGDRILRSKGEINGGGDSIDLKSHGGDIYIKKGL